MKNVAKMRTFIPPPLPLPYVKNDFPFADFK